MRLSVTLSPKCERKWKRIAAYMGKDIDALLVAGIDYALIVGARTQQSSD